jgi:hypothetical protein
MKGKDKFENVCEFEMQKGPVSPEEMSTSGEHLSKTKRQSIAVLKPGADTS